MNTEKRIAKERIAIDLYNKYSKRLYNTSLRILSSPMDAEEIMQDCLIKFIQKAPKLEYEGQIYNWLKTTCIRASIDHIKSAQKWKELFNSEKEIYISSDNESFRKYDEEKTKNLFAERTKEDIKIILEEISNLAKGYQLIINLHLIEGFDYEEIASILDIEQTTVRSQYHRAKKKLTKRIINRLNN